MLPFENGNLVRFVEIRKRGIPPCESEATRATRDGDVAEFGGGEVEGGALEAERAAELRAGVEAGGEEPRERQRALAQLVHHADAVRAPQHGRILRVPARRDHVVERDDAALETPQSLLLLRLLALHGQHGGIGERCEEARVVHVEVDAAWTVVTKPSCSFHSKQQAHSHNVTCHHQNRKSPCRHRQNATWHLPLQSDSNWQLKSCTTRRI